MKYFLIIFIVVFFTGCSQISPSIQEERQQSKLTNLLVSLSSDIEKEEAQKLSYELIKHAKELNTLYKRDSSPWMHNFFVNAGFKKRGLCWHFTYDMIKHINSLDLKSFDFYIAGANIDAYWSEHNSLVVTCKGCKFEKGILIDAWRDTQKLYFSKLHEDNTYIWSQRGGLQND